MEPAGTRRATKLLFSLTLFLILFGQIFQHYFGENRDLQNGDFYVYFYAGRVIHHNRHADLYRGATDSNPQYRTAYADSDLGRIASAAKANIGMYLYPPLLADVFAPVSGINAPLAGRLWKTWNIFLILGSLLLLLRLLKIPILSLETAVLVAATYSLIPVEDAISMGQVTIMMFALWTIGICAYAEDAVVLSALAIALATALKVTPICIVPLFLIWKDRRWLVSYFGGLVALILFMDAVSGWQNLVEFMHVASAMGSGIPIELNRCLSAVIAWVYMGHFMPVPPNGDPAPEPAHALALITKAATVIVFAASLWPVWTRRNMQTPSSRAIILAVFALIAIVVAPVSWRHAYVIAIIPLTLLWTAALRDGSPGLLRPVLLAVATISLGTVFFDAVAASSLPELLRISVASVGNLSSLALCFNVLYSPQIEQDC